MPEAPARPRDPDLTITPEARPAPRPRAGSGRRAPAPRAAPPALVVERLRGRIDGLLGRPVVVVGAIMGLAAISAVAVNALSFQKGRHPAPLFAKAEPKPEPKADAKPEPRPEPRQAKAAPSPAAPARDGIAEVLRGDAASTASLPPHDAPARPPSASQKTLASLPPPHPKPAAEPKPAPERAALAKVTVKKDAGRDAAGKPDPQVVFVQKALVKLGYGPLTVDGVFGPGTRAALGRFEHERRLPGTPDVPSRTVKELASRSGLTPR
jgi:hypothetical protein